MNPNQAIEEITCKVVGTNVLTRYNNITDRIDNIEWKTFLKVNRYSDLNWYSKCIYTQEICIKPIIGVST